jgi:ubiquinone/menaquinone biosynthesis C-methylase UbiE
VVKACEQQVVYELLAPSPGDVLLDAGCGTALFTLGMLASGASVIGLDVSPPMLKKGARRCRDWRFSPVVADMRSLPFKDETFDKTVSVTALEFIADGKAAIQELFRVTRSKGVVVVATLNNLSPWAHRRREEAARKETVLSKAIFRSPEELLALSPLPGAARTAVHFQKETDPREALRIEREGRNRGLLTGAFVAVRWQKP